MSFSRKVLSDFASDFHGNIFLDIPLAKLTSWRIGGPADALVQVHDISELKHLVTCLKQNDIPWIVLGKGTNILFHDKGFRGVIIQLIHSFKRIDVLGHRVTVGGGTLLGNVLAEAARHGLSGLEVFAGIPGTSGAAIILNAGAHGDSVLNHISQIKVLDGKLIQKDITPDAHTYRYSGIPPHYIVCTATFHLNPGDGHNVFNGMAYYLKYRTRTQPLDKPSAGCTFKNPSGEGAGRLIDACGLKGFRQGGAEISRRHANFIINTGTASASDVRTLIRIVIEKVENKFGEHLDLEVIVLDETGNRLSPEMEAF